MRIVVLSLLIALASGCAHTHTTLNAGAASTTTTTTGASVSVHAHSHGLAALIFAGIFLAAALDYQGEPPLPEMAADRRVNVQDCTRPIDETAGNLKCR